MAHSRAKIAILRYEDRANMMGVEQRLLYKRSQTAQGVSGFNASHRRLNTLDAITAKV